MDNMKHLYKDAGDRVLSIDYDDLVSNPQEFMNDITNYLEIEPIEVNPAAIHQTQYKTPLLFSEKQINNLNK